MAKILAACAALAALAVASAINRPNIIFFLTDDQDVLLDSMSYMNATNQLIVNKGMTCEWSFAAVPVCCPSRASLHTGLYQQNTLVVNNSIPGNCAGTAWINGPERRTAAAYLQSAGYKTFFGGKYLNNYGGEAEPVTHVPPGWTDWQALVGNSVYYNYTLSNNGQAEPHGHDYHADYLTDLVRNRSLNFIDRWAQSGEPMYLVLSTPASHQPADPAPQYSTLFPGIQAPRHPNFNVHIPDTHWFEDVQGVTGPLDDNGIAFVDWLYRRRLQTLQSVDEAVSQVVAKLEAYGLLNNTYIFYTADNGYHLGNGGLGLDKRQPWHYDSRVPLYVSGPGVPAGSKLTAPVSNVDLAPTFLDLAGLPVPSHMDGISLKSALLGAQAQAPAVDGDDREVEVAVVNAGGITRQSVLVSYHGESASMPPKCGLTDRNLYCQWQTNTTTAPYWFGNDWCSCQDVANNTYACMFTVNASINARYCEFSSTGFVEYFVISEDPFEMTNKAGDLPDGVREQLHSELTALAQCSGGTQCSLY